MILEDLQSHSVAPGRLPALRYYPRLVELGTSREGFVIGIQIHEDFFSLELSFDQPNVKITFGVLA